MHPSPAFPLRGVSVVRLISALRALGHRVELFELGAGSGAVGYVRARGRVAEAIRILLPDVLHVHYGPCGLAVPRTDAPIVTTFVGDDLNGTPDRSGRTTWKSRVGILLSHYAARRSRRCIAVSASLRSRLWSAALRKKTVVIRDAVDPELFQPLPRAAARERLGLPPDAVLVMFPHDTTQPTKRLWLAEVAVAELQRHVPAAQLWVVNGKPPDEMPWHYAAADAMIVTSLREGGPSSVKEALACGIPVVSVAVGDTDLFGEVPERIRVAAANAGALAAALHDALKMPRERRSLLPPGLELREAAQAVVAVYRQAMAP